MTERDDGTQRHTLLADAQGLVFGTAMTGLAVTLLTHLGLATGQTAGLAVLVAYVTGQPFGLVFFLINLPFYWFGLRRLGLRFTLKTFIAVALLSVVTALLPRFLTFGEVHPALGAVYFGMMAGTGLLALFRHGASLGGVGILALYLQDKTGFRAGWTQLIFDSGVFVFAAFVLEPDRLLWSLLGAIVVNLVIAINHRRDWYVAT